MNAPTLVDEPELVQAVARIAARLDQPLARQVIDLVASAYDAGYASCLVRPFTASDTARERLAQAAAIVAKHLPTTREE